MLDEMSLSDKLKAASIWFQRASDGDMPFTERTAQRFNDLLRQCEHEAVMLTAKLEIQRGTVAILHGQNIIALADALTEQDVPLEVIRAVTYEGGAS